MAEHVTTEGLSLGSLFRGVFGDLRGLVRQEIALAKAELLKEWGKAKAAAGAMAAGAAVLAVGALLLCLAGVSALHEAAGLPWWASFLAVGGTFTLIGAGLLYGGRRKAGQVHVIPTHAARAVSEGAETAGQPAAEEPPPSAAAKGEETGGATWGLLGVALVAGVALEKFLGRRSARGGAEAPAAAASSPAAPGAEGAGGRGFLEKLAEQVGAEFEKLQDQAVAVLAALVRDLTQKGIAALADVVQEKVGDAAARLAADAPPQAEGGQPDAPAGPMPPEPPAV